MRNYNLAHPDAIFKDNPTHFIGVLKSNGMLPNYIPKPLIIISIKPILIGWEGMPYLKPIALFIIKPK